MASKILENDLLNKGVLGMADKPGLSAKDMQYKFEEIQREIIIPKLNEVIGEVGSMLSPFDNKKTYAVGEYCIYKDELYKCIDAVTIPGTWNDEKWGGTTLSDALKDLQSQVDNAIKESANAVAEEVAARKAEIAIERARIDSIAKLPEGSTTGDAELIDGRVDYKGNTHTNIGEHIREVSSQLSGEIANLPFQNVDNITNVVYTANKSNPEKWLPENMIYNKSSGAIITFDAYRGTEKIKVEGNVVYSNGNQYAFFDENNVFVSGGNNNNFYKTIGGEAFYKLDIPENAKYVAYNFQNTSTCYVYFTKPTKLEEYGKIVDFELDDFFLKVIGEKYFQRKVGLNGKSFSILGDSYSTYYGWLPTGFESWYANNGVDGENTQSNSLDNVTKTWWYKLMSENGMKLLINDSFSGTTISTTSWGGIDTVNSFAGRSKLLCEDNVTKEKPDLIFILGGLNDTWGNSPIGTVKYNDITVEDLKSTLPAFSFIIAKLKKYNPQAKIVNLKLSSLPTELLNGMDAICTHYAIDNILLDWNSISKENSHPTESGMTSIKKMIVDYLSK